MLRTRGRVVVLLVLVLLVAVCVAVPGIRGWLATDDQMPQGVTVLGIVVPVLALVVAAWSVVRASATARRERRLDFELDVLKELADLNGQGENVAMRETRMRVRARLLPMADVPVLRAAAGVPSTAEAQREVKAMAQPGSASLSSARGSIQEEIDAAIQQRLDAR